MIAFDELRKILVLADVGNFHTWKDGSVTANAGFWRARYYISAG